MRMPPDPILGPIYSVSSEEETQPIPIATNEAESATHDVLYERYLADFMRMARRAFWIDVAIAVLLFVLALGVMIFLLGQLL